MSDSYRTTRAFDIPRHPPVHTDIAGLVAELRLTGLLELASLLESLAAEVERLKAQQAGSEPVALGWVDALGLRLFRGSASNHTITLRHTPLPGDVPLYTHQAPVQQVDAPSGAWERERFEAKWPMPANCTWTGAGYASTQYHAWQADDQQKRWEGWNARAALAAQPGGTEPQRAPKANMFHDAGAIAQCQYCKRYTLDPKAIGDRQPLCTCGKQQGWSGSFKPPGPDAQWHGPAAPQRAQPEGVAS